MRKEELIEKYPELIEQITKEFSANVFLDREKTVKELWNEYLEENKPKVKHDFLVLKLKNKDNGNIYFNYCNQFVNPKYEKTKIPYKYGIEKYEIIEVKYKEKEYSIGDFVMWDNLCYIINSFEIDEHKLICFLENENNIIKKQIEYITLVDKNPDFKVLCINLPHHNQLWLSNKTNHFCGIDGKNVIEYEKGLLLGTVTSVKYKDTQFSIDDVVQYLDKTYTIYSFKEEQVNLKSKNGIYYYETHISNITKLKPLGVTEDGFDYYLNDPLQWIFNSSLTKNWEFLYQLKAWTNHPKSIKESNNYKVFHNKDNALKFIEENNKKSLFVTVDNIEILEGDYFYVLYKNGEVGKWKAQFDQSWLYEEKDGRLLFSSKEALDNCKLKHAKVLSYDDITQFLTPLSENEITLLNLVKQRLK